MNETGAAFNLYYRLIALWVLAEVFIGGLIHALRLVGTGLIVGSSAVVCMSLIALHYRQRGLILKATIIVLLFKFTLSPQSSFAAYVAVLFQGVVGELIYSSRLRYSVKCYLVALLALVESCFQRILILTIVFGKSFWSAFDDFVQRVIPASAMNYAVLLIAVYVCLHIAMGLFVGRWCAALPRRLLGWKQRMPVMKIEALGSVKMDRSRKRKRTPWVVVLWLLLLGLFAWQFFFSEANVMATDKLALMLVRSATIVGCWVLIVSPLLRSIFRKLSAKGRHRFHAEMEVVAGVIPEVKGIIEAAWRASSKSSGYRRLRHFSKLVVANVIA